MAEMSKPRDAQSLPSLSVAIPNFNDGRFLERCLCSVFAQDLEPLEVIVFDDGSTDGSLELLRELGKRWPRLKVVECGENRGVVNVINRALDEIKGEWVHFLAADDLPLPGFYRLAMRKAALHPTAGAAFGAFVTSHEDTGERFTETADKWISPGFALPKRMLWKLFHKAPALFSLGYANIWRVRALREIGGFNPELLAYSDTVAFRCLTAKHGGIYLGGSPVVCVRVSEKTYGGQVWNDRESYLKLLLDASRFMRERFPELFPERYLLNWEAKLPYEIGLKPWPKLRRAKHAASLGFYHLWLAVTRLLGR